MLLVLDALREDDGTGLLALEQHRADERGHLGGRTVLDEAHVELDDVGAHERQQRERVQVSADVVERDAPAAVADRSDGA